MPSDTASPALTELASGLRFPEGPIAMPDGSVILVEIERGTLTKVAPDGTVSYVAKPGGGPNGAAIGPDGRVFVCNNGGFNWTPEGDPSGLRPIGQADNYSGGRIEAIDLATGAVEVLYTECDGHKLRGPNDLVFDGLGARAEADTDAAASARHPALLKSRRADAVPSRSPDQQHRDAVLR